MHLHQSDAELSGRDFRALRVQLRFQARETIRFPALAGNALRGAIGLQLASELFRPAAPDSSPSGFETPPPPFVIRAGHLNHQRFNRAQSFTVGLFVFDLQPEVLRRLAIAFAALEDEGLGPSRGRAALEEVSYDELDFDLGAVSPCHRLEVVFESPTELKGVAQASACRPPEFAVLLARARDRVSTLRSLYQGGPVETDFAALGARAGAVRLTAGSVSPFEEQRKSTRTGQRHPMNGFIGSARYEGALGEFVPWLHAAEATGVGRHTVWGFGAIRVETKSPD